MKLCKDCKHVDTGENRPSDSWKCTLAMEFSPVDGVFRYPDGKVAYCEIIRHSQVQPCGIDGKLWEPSGPA